MGTRALTATIVANMRDDLTRLNLSPRALGDLADLPGDHLLAFFDGREELTLNELGAVAGALGVHPADFLIGAS